MAKIISPSLISQAIPLTSTYASKTLDIQHINDVSFQIQYSGSTVNNGGEFFIQASSVFRDANRGPSANDWVTIPVVDEQGNLVNMTTAVGSGQYLAKLKDLPYSFLRVIFTRTNADGTAEVWMSGKEK